MIIAQQKPLTEINTLLGDAENVLVVGCGTCVTVCFAGGTKEVEILATSLRMASNLDGRKMNIQEVTVQRQCEWEYLEEIRENIAEHDVILSLGCGIGVQALVELFPEKWVVPGLNTSFLGLPDEHGVWVERCAACGDCVLGLTGGICPIARCSKSLLNGPCGGSEDGHCELDPDIPCAWNQIYERLEKLGKLELMMTYTPPKSWSTARHGGPRKIVRPDLFLSSGDKTS